MKAPLLVTAASLAGLLAFGWTVASYRPPPGAPYSEAMRLPTRMETAGSPRRADWPPRLTGDAALDIPALEEYTSRFPSDPRGWYSLGWARQDHGNEDMARECWKKALALLADETAWPVERRLFNLARYRAVLGDREGAISAWAAAVDAGWSDAERARRDRALDLIRDDPRFGEAMDRISPGPNVRQLSAG